MDKISSLIESQFPGFYQEHGPEFIAFVRAYYEWLEEEGNILNDARDFLNFIDIDLARDKFLPHFRAKYMAGIPEDILGNQRFLHKHILDLYRSKGSEAGIRLLFRLLFNEDIEIYVPHYDIFRTSDNTWIEPRYIEVTTSTHLTGLDNQYIWGGGSGASAIVEGFERKKVNNGIVNLLRVSNIKGEFKVGETILSYDMPDNFPPIVIGSPVKLDVLSSSSDFNVGDILIEQSKGMPMRAVVAETYESFGIIIFEIVDGGSYYSLDADVQILPGANTTGFGAEFVISSIEDTSPFTLSTDKLLPYADVALNAEAYGFPSLPEANAEYNIQQSLDIVTIDVGRIGTIVTTNPGTGYDGDVLVVVTDPHTSTRKIETPGGYGGEDAIITGEALSGVGLISQLDVYDASYTYNSEEVVQFNSEDGTLSAAARIVLGGVGHAPGYFDNNNSFTSDTKYLFDGHYYQDFSYEIRSERTLASYIDVLKKLVHIGGNAVYGIFKTINYNEFKFKIVYDDIVQHYWVLQSGEWDDQGIWIDYNESIFDGI